MLVNGWVWNASAESDEYDGRRSVVGERVQAQRNEIKYTQLFSLLVDVRMHAHCAKECDEHDEHDEHECHYERGSA